MSRILGANWPTTVSGIIFTLAIAISADPQLIAFLPPSWQATVKGICGLIAVLAGGTFAWQAKSKNVTGGTIQQTAKGAVASISSQTKSASVEDTQIAQPKP